MNLFNAHASLFMSCKGVKVLSQNISFLYYIFQTGRTLRYLAAVVNLNELISLYLWLPLWLMFFFPNKKNLMANVLIKYYN